MNRLIGAASLALVMTCGTSAYGQTWTGAYIGANGGLAFGKADAVTDAPEPGPYFAGSSLTAIAEAGMQRIEPRGLLAGGQLGFNVQSGSAVFGVEADFGLMQLDETASVTVEYPCCAGTDFTIEQGVETQWLLTVRPRVGVAAGNVLVYGTGGIAITNLDYTATFDDTFATAHADSQIQERRIGFTFGGGVEVGGGGRASFKAEYLVTDFGSVEMVSDNFTLNDPPVPSPAIVFPHMTDLRVQVFRAGVNVRF
jgi:outer membrane immunogenic protein